jgi:CheY-like chemotaxis protein
MEHCMASYSILIADDELPIRILMRRLFHGAGFSVFEAGSGPMALQIALENSLDVIVIDLAMPGLAGRPVIASLRRHTCYQALPIFVMSGNALELAAIDAAPEEPTYLLAKPFMIDRVLAMVIQSCELARQARF